MPQQSTAFPLPPGSTIGILGSGQLGRMLAMAAARIGMKCHVYADSPGPACDVAAKTTIARYDDYTALSVFARTVDVVTYEFENVAEATAHHLAALVPVRPGAKALAVAQDRLTEKMFIGGLGIPVAPFVAINSVADLRAAMIKKPARAILKTRHLGYDGKGQANVEPGGDDAAAFIAIGQASAVLEQRLAFTREISVLICRAADGFDAIYDLPENVHRDGILRRSQVPAPHLPEPVDAHARSIARHIAGALDYVGLLAVELFDLGDHASMDQRLIVNEIAPRVHNSGHWTIDACATSQFENHMRAVAGWPLASPERHSDAIMHNLIGADALGWAALAREPGCCLHLYGKHEARPGRKMGHVTRLTPKTNA